VRRIFLVAVIAAMSAGLATTGLLSGPASAAPAVNTAGQDASVHSAARNQAAATRLPLSERQLLSDERLHKRAATQTGSVTGVTVSATGQPLAGICVVAHGPGGIAGAATKADGRYFITGLRPGVYHLHYQQCGDGVRYLPEWYGDTTGQAGSRPVVISRSTVQPLAAITLQSLAQPAAGIDVINPSSRAAMAQSVRASLGLPDVPPPPGRKPASGYDSPAVRFGHIDGVITAPDGKPLAGMCVQIDSISSYYYAFGTSNKAGFYRTPSVPPGRYDVIFYPGCGNTGNWLVQIYRNQYTLHTATKVLVTTDRATTGINATMAPGAEISGTVATPSGHGLRGVCVDPMMTGDHHRLYLGALSKAGGTYHLLGLPAGYYRIAYIPCSGRTTPYASMWWHNAQVRRTANVFKLGKGQLATRVNEVLPLGAVVTGRVTSAVTGLPLKGMCVFAYTLSENALTFGGQAATNAAGRYAITGLSTGAYGVSFGPGCNSNANYLGVGRPGVLRVTDARTRSGINAALPTGASMTGTVTSAATGKPIKGICVSAISQDGEYFNVVASNVHGNYLMDQMPGGTYYVQFFGGCGSKGSYAPLGYGGPNVDFPGPLKVRRGGVSVTGIDAALQPGATIAGTVTSTRGTKLRGICVFPVLGGQALAEGVTSKGGGYTVSNLPPGQYQLIYEPGCGNNWDLQAIWFGQQELISNAPFVSANAGETTGINARVPAGGSIAGIVRNKHGSGILFSCIYLTGLSGPAVDGSGEGLIFGPTYEFTGLVPGAYHVTFVPACTGSAYQSQWFKFKPSPAGATKVIIKAGQTRYNVASRLVRGGTISGTITLNHKPVRDMCVFAQNVTQFLDYGFGFTSKTGKYVVTGLNSGQYELVLEPCGPGSQELALQLLTRVVTVRAPHNTGDINATASDGGVIAGQVKGGSPATAQPGICVDAFQLNGYAEDTALADQNGRFEMGNLPPGEYQVYLNDTTCGLLPTGLAPVWYPEAATLQQAQDVRVSPLGVTRLAAAILPPDGGITGTVTRSGGGALPGVCVSARSVAAGSQAVYAVTGGNGDYSIAGLAPGSYLVEFSSGCGASGFLTQWWNGTGAEVTANVVKVTSGVTTTGIGASMRK
jgi:hypothetical protein